MDNALNLILNQTYIVIKPFTDYDGIVHGIGESWIYKGTNFLLYDDGLTLHVISNNNSAVYRLQWRKEEQAEIIENFKDYVEPC